MSRTNVRKLAFYKIKSPHQISILSHAGRMQLLADRWRLSNVSQFVHFVFYFVAYRIFTAITTTRYQQRTQVSVPVFFFAVFPVTNWDQFVEPT